MIAAGQVAPTDYNLGTQWGETINSPAPTMAADAPAGSAAPAAEGGGIGAPMGAMLAMNAGAAISGIINSYYGAKVSEITADAQLKSGQSQYAHQDRMAEIQKETQINLLKKQSEAIEYKAEHNDAYLKSVEKRKEAEDNLAFAKEQVKVKNSYEKDLKTYDKAVDKLFGRHGYYSGSPVTV